MSELKFGPRIGREAEIRCGAAAFIQDQQGAVLLTRRADNGRWCLPGGHIDPGESAAEACVREVLEETGLQVEVIRLIGVYSTPDAISVYPDGNKAQFVSLCFEARIVGGQLANSPEVTSSGYFDIETARSLDILETHLPRIEDGLKKKEAAFVR